MGATGARLVASSLTYANLPQPAAPHPTPAPTEKSERESVALGHTLQFDALVARVPSARRGDQSPARSDPGTQLWDRPGRARKGACEESR